MQLESPSKSTQAHATSDKLTLVMIGHSPDAHYLTRLLDQIKPIIKRICFVNTDDTNDCFNVLFASDLEFDIKTKIYKKRKDFHFSECRNLALSMTEPGEWCIWFDCDDQVPEPQRILDDIARFPDGDGYLLPYNVNGRYDNLNKLRVFRAGEFHWVGKVHEELIATSDKSKPRLYILQNCMVVHSPDDGKSNHEFHLSLLRNDSNATDDTTLYIGRENFNLGYFYEAYEPLAYCARNHKYKHVQYECLLKLAHVDRADGNIAICEDRLKDAITIQPHRREAYYFLAELLGILGKDRLKEGLAYISAANAQLDFHELGQDEIIYKRQCYKLHAKYLQAFNYYKPALAAINRIKPEFMDDEARNIKEEIEECLRQT